MTAASLLTDLIRQGASVTGFAGRLRVEAARGVLTTDIREALAARKADLLQLLAFAGEYRDLLHTATLMAAADLRDAQARLIDELGPDLATVIRDVELHGAGPQGRNAQSEFNQA